MARYIDADALLSRLPDDLPYKASVKRVLIQAPTADVAPRAEVEQLKRDLEQCENGYRQEMHLLQCKLASAQRAGEEAQADAGRLAKVYARLIFAELEEFNRPPLPECEPLYVIKKSEMEALKERLGVQRWIKPKH